MTTSTLTPYRSGRPPGRDGFAQLLRAEWTKFRTVRGWLMALLAAALLAVLATIGIAGAGNGTQNSGAQNPGATGPNGEAVTDQFEFAHQPLAGNGTLTVAVTSLTGHVQVPPGGGFGPFVTAALPPGPQPWSKAGIIMKASTRPGSAYAAVMVTAGHGVRMQYNYTHDIAGQSGAPSTAAPAWLRLTRSGDTVTGYDSADGTRWTKVGTATLAGLPSTVQAGMFTASPDVFLSDQGFASNNGAQFSTLGTGTFGHLSRQGNWPASSWSDSHVGGLNPTKVKVSCGPHCGRIVRTPHQAGVQSSGGTFAVTGSGDIAPYVPILDPLGLSFKGTLVGLIAVIALAALFITAEYRRGMIRTTFTASPHRGRVLAAKALVIGTVTFVAGLAGAAAALVVTTHKLSRDRLGDLGLPGLVAAERAWSADGGGNRRAVRAGRDPGGGGRRDPAPQRRRDHGRHRRPGRPADPGHAAADGACAVAAAAHPGRRVQRAAGHPVLFPGDPHLPAVQRLLPPVAVARVRGAGDLDGARAGRCRPRAPPAGRMSAGRHAQLAGPAVALATRGPAAGRP